MPIGLIDSSWGGTIVEAWSPPEALAACDVTDNGIGEENNHNEYLWNGMIYPLLKMTIRFNRSLIRFRLFHILPGELCGIRESKMRVTLESMEDGTGIFMNALSRV